jgi:hypothetical protein
MSCGSLQARPSSSTAIGRPSEEKPLGTTIAGRPEFELRTPGGITESPLTFRVATVRDFRARRRSSYLSGSPKPAICPQLSLALRSNLKSLMRIVRSTICSFISGTVTSTTSAPLPFMASRRNQAMWARLRSVPLETSYASKNASVPAKRIVGDFARRRSEADIDSFKQRSGSDCRRDFYTRAPADEARD